MRRFSAAAASKIGYVETGETENMKTILTGIFLLAFNSLGLYCQPATAPPRPAFEVASIKIARNPAQVCIFPCTGERLTVEGSRVDIRFMSLYQLIVRAYRVKPYQLSGPNWMTSQKFDRFVAGAPQHDDMTLVVLCV